MQPLLPAELSPYVAALLSAPRPVRVGLFALAVLLFAVVAFLPGGARVAHVPAPSDLRHAMQLPEDNSSTIAGRPPTVLVATVLAGIPVLRSCLGWACMDARRAATEGDSELQLGQQRSLQQSAGVVLLYHSCAYSKGSWATLPRERAIVDQLHSRRFHLVAFSSPPRGVPLGSRTCWDTSPAAAAALDGDVARTSDVLAAVLGGGGSSSGGSIVVQPRPASCASAQWPGPGPAAAAAAAPGDGGPVIVEHPVFALGVASGGSFALHLATLVPLTGAVAVALSRPLPFSVEPAETPPEATGDGAAGVMMGRAHRHRSPDGQPAPATGRGHPHLPPQPRSAAPTQALPLRFLVRGGGGLLTPMPAAVQGGGGGGREHAAVAESSPSALVLARAAARFPPPRALPPLLLLPVLPSDPTLRPPLAVGLAELVGTVGVSSFVGSAAMYGVAPAITAANGLHAVAEEAVAARMADADQLRSARPPLGSSPAAAAAAPAVSCAAAGGGSSASSSSSVSVLPLTPRLLCPWTLHTSVPWAFSPVASAALFQLLVDAGAAGGGDDGGSAIAATGARTRASRSIAAFRVLQEAAAGGEAFASTPLPDPSSRGEAKDVPRVPSRWQVRRPPSTVEVAAAELLETLIALRQRPDNTTTARVASTGPRSRSSGGGNAAAQAASRQRQHQQVCTELPAPRQCYRLAFTLSAWPPLGTRAPADEDSGGGGVPSWEGGASAGMAAALIVPVASALTPDPAARFVDACRPLLKAPTSAAVAALLDQWASGLVPLDPGAGERLPTHAALCGGGDAAAPQQQALHHQHERRQCWPVARPRTGSAVLDAVYWGARVAVRQQGSKQQQRPESRVAAGAVVLEQSLIAGTLATSVVQTTADALLRNAAIESALQVLDDVAGSRGVASDLHVEAAADWLSRLAAAPTPPAQPEAPDPPSASAI